MVVINGHANIMNNFSDFLFWTVLFQPHLYYIVYGIFASLAYVLLVSVFINAAQKELKEETIILNFELKKMIVNFSKQDSEDETIHNFNDNKKIIFHLLSKFYQVNQKLSALCTAFQAHITFCRPLLSIIFPLYIGISCYIAFAIAFVGVPTMQKYVYLVALTVVTTLLFVITAQCAVVVKENGRLSKQMAVFAFLYCQFLDAKNTNCKTQRNSIFTLNDNWKVFGRMLFKVIWH